MTLPHEELRSVERGRDLAMAILFDRPAPSMRELRNMARSVLHHWPFDLEKHWEDTVCLDCGETKWFCRCECNK